MKKIKKMLKKIKKHIKKIIKLLNKNIVFSIGENCLTDNILARNGLKSFSSPYASARSNVEYILNFEKEEFKDFLNPEFLVYEPNSNGLVPRNKKHTETFNNYHNSCVNGFEFTHHDVIGNKDAKKKIIKRCKRMLALKNKNIIMLYHHRFCEDTDMKMLNEHLNSLAESYEKRGNTVSVFLFTQKIVPSEDKRRVERLVDGKINTYVFHTMNVWGGDNEEYLWARCDDDLIETMIKDIKGLLI